jgi:hypothetical protein
MIEKAHQQRPTRGHEPHHAISGTPGTRKSPEQQAEVRLEESFQPLGQAEVVATSNNADKDRQNELASRSAAYSSKTPSPFDNNERLVLAQLVGQIADESRALSGVANGNLGGLQQPRVAGTGTAR